MDVIHNYEQVYFVEAPEGVRVNPVAIRPEIYEDRVQWLDTSKGKIIRLGKIDNMDELQDSPPDTIEITAKDGTHFRLKKLTLDIYNESVKDRVMLPPSFSSDEEVQTFYLESDFEIY